jgi:hypothetical protein
MQTVGVTVSRPRLINDMQGCEFVAQKPQIGYPGSRSRDAPQREAHNCGQHARQSGGSARPETFQETPPIETDNPTSQQRPEGLRTVVGLQAQ